MMEKTIKRRWFRRPRSIFKKKSYQKIQDSQDKQEKNIRYPVEAGVCVMVFGNRILCGNQAMCYCEFVRDLVNRVVDYREMN